MNKFLSILLCFPFFLGAQLSFNEQHADLGNIPEAYEISGDFVISNGSDKKVFLMRADADKGVKVFASRKTLLPGDTALLVISFIPSADGKFKKKILLVSSDQARPYELSLSGNIAKLKADDKLACFYFGSRKNSRVKTIDSPIVAVAPEGGRDMSNKIPDLSGSTTTISVPEKKQQPEKIMPPPLDETGEMPVLKYKPNNILFLIDVSSSMRDSLKLPLMKTALYTLIDAVRDIDRITLVTYADSIKIIKEGVSGEDKKELKRIVASLTAKGYTKGKKAILASQKIAQTHFIEGGNNQIIMATDGKFNFYPTDQQKWLDQQGDKKITLTTVAFGNDREAVKNLKEISEKGEGSFIHIKKREGSEKKLLEEIKARSQR